MRMSQEDSVGIQIKVSGPGVEDHRARSCSSKIRYGSKTSARKAVLRMRNKASKPLEEYRCEFCGGWHIGRKMGWREKALVWALKKSQGKRG